MAVFSMAKLIERQLGSTISTVIPDEDMAFFYQEAMKYSQLRGWFRTVVIPVKGFYIYKRIAMIIMVTLLKVDFSMSSCWWLTVNTSIQ